MPSASPPRRVMAHTEASPGGPWSQSGNRSESAIELHLLPGQAVNLPRVNKVDRELAQVEARSAEAKQATEETAPKSKVRDAMKRWAKDKVVRRTSTKR